MSEDKYALSEAWSNSNEYKKPFDYTLENTRQTVLLRRLDMGDLLKLGIAEELDFMSKALFADDSSASAKEAVNTAVLKSQNFTKMEHMVNSVVMAGVIKPQLHAIPLHEAARQPGLVYVDSVPFSDRMELFGVIFDSEGLSTFRKEQETGVGNVPDVSDVPLPPNEPVAVRPADSQGLLF